MSNLQVHVGHEFGCQFFLTEHVLERKVQCLIQCHRHTFMMEHGTFGSDLDHMDNMDNAHCFSSVHTNAS